MRSCHPVWSHLNGIPTGHLHFIMLSAGQGRDRQPAQVGRRSHTHQNRVKSRKEAVQALGRNVGLLVSTTEPLHRRNAERGRDLVRKGSDTQGSISRRNPPAPDSLLARAGALQVTILQRWTKKGLQKVNVNFSWPVQGNISSTLLLHTSQV